MDESPVTSVTTSIMVDAPVDQAFRGLGPPRRDVVRVIRPGRTNGQRGDGRLRALRRYSCDPSVERIDDGNGPEMRGPGDGQHRGRQAP